MLFDRNLPTAQPQLRQSSIVQFTVSRFSFNTHLPGPLQAPQTPVRPTKPADGQNPHHRIPHRLFNNISSPQGPQTPLPSPSGKSSIQTDLYRYFATLWRPSHHIPKSLTAPDPRPPASRLSLRQQLLRYQSDLSQRKITAYTAPSSSEQIDDTWGHTLAVIDPSTAFRLFLQNPNGLSIATAPLNLHQDLIACHKYGTAVVSMPETNTNWDLHHIRDCFSGLVRKTWKQSVLQPSKGPETFLADKQPGGTTTLICDNWVARVSTRGEDPLGLGCWSYVTLRGKQGSLITVITAYNASRSYGDTTNYQQQTHFLSRLYRENKLQHPPEPHCHFILDLQSWIESLLLLGHGIILALDANEAYDPDSSSPLCPLTFQTGKPTTCRPQNGKLGTLISTCGLLDPLFLQHPECPFPASHARGSKRIDFILVTPNLMPAVLRLGSLAFNSLMFSDHRPY